VLVKVAKEPEVMVLDDTSSPVVVVAELVRIPD